MTNKKSKIQFFIIGILFSFFTSTGYLIQKNGDIEWSLLNTILIVLFSFVVGCIVAMIFIFSLNLWDKREKRMENAKEKKYIGYLSILLLCGVLY